MSNLFTGWKVGATPSRNRANMWSRVVRHQHASWTKDLKNLLHLTSNLAPNWSTGFGRYKLRIGQGSYQGLRTGIMSTSRSANNVSVGGKLQQLILRPPGRPLVAFYIKSHCARSRMN